MTKMMTEETPAKVMGLLAVALSSMFMLFAVSSTNASFEKTELAFPDPFNPAKVAAVFDNTAAKYSFFLNQNLFTPVKSDLAMYHSDLAWVIDNSDQQILAYTGLSGLVDAGQPQVAGAFTDHPYQAASSPNFLLALLGIK